jgi:hypothetical protein
MYNFVRHMFVSPIIVKSDTSVVSLYDNGIIQFHFIVHLSKDFLIY